MTMANPRPQQTPLRPGLTSAHQASHEVTQLWAPLPSQGCDTQAQSHMQLKGQRVTDRHGVGSVRRRAFRQWSPRAQVITWEAPAVGEPGSAEVIAVPARRSGSLEPSMSE